MCSSSVRLMRQAYSACPANCQKCRASATNTHGFAPWVSILEATVSKISGAEAFQRLHIRLEIAIPSNISLNFVMIHSCPRRAPRRGPKKSQTRVRPCLRHL